MITRPSVRVKTAIVGIVALLCSLVFAAEPALAQAAPRLNEVVSVNGSGIVDGYGSTSDWIELHNPTGAAVDLTGWGLSDDPNAPLRWIFPAGSTLAAGGYLVVFASGEVSIGAELHVPFSLASDGEWLSLARPDGTIASALQVPALLPDHSYGVSSNNAIAVFTSPTPGVVNPAGADGILDDVVVTPGRGFFTAPVSVTLSHLDPGVVIRYTTDSTPPTAATGTVYAGPFTLSETSTLRIAAFRDGWITGPSATHTYVFAADVPLQPAMFGPNVDTEGERQLIVEGLTALPTISIVTNQAINQAARVGTSVEWIDPDGGPGFQVDAGIQEVGGTSVRYAKDSWRLAFDSEWGESSLNFPVFEGFESQGTVDPVDEFKRLTLRTGAHDAGFWPGSGFTHRGSWVRARWGDETMLELGHVNSHGRWVNVYFNGQYWGQYQVREHFNDHFMESYFGGDNSQYLGVNRGVVSNGSGDGWDAAVAAAGSWTTWKEWVDPVAYVDWMLINEFQGNFWDVSELQNWRGAGQASSAATEPGFIFQGSDQDITFALPDRATKFTGGPAGSWAALRAERHPDFLALVNDRVDALLRDDGALTIASATDRWQRMAVQIEASMHAELARWAGSYVRTQQWDTWRSDIEWLADNIISVRTAYTLDRMAAYGLLSAVQVPEITGGAVPNGSLVPITNPNGAGQVFVTLDGTDPRVDGGGVDPTAVAMTEILVNRSLTITARALVNGEWSALVQVAFTPIIDPNAPVIAQSRDLVTVAGWGVRHQIEGSDPNGDAVSFSVQGLPGGLVIDPQSGVVSGTTTAVGERSVVVSATDGNTTTAMAFSWTVLAHDGPADLPVVLNEYNAVKSSEFLADDGIDSTLGRVVGNGGDWIELLVTADGTDLRGWSVELWDRENGPLENSDTIVFADNAVLSDLAAGTLITIGETVVEDLTYSHLERDWTLTARSATGFASALVTADAGNFDSNRHDFRIRLRDAAGVSRSPFMGETDQWRSFGNAGGGENVGGDEVFARCDSPSALTDPVDGDSRDVTTSTQGLPNLCGGVVQDLLAQRDGFRGDADCDGVLSITDALVIARYEVQIADATPTCDAWQPGQALLSGSDFNKDGTPNIVDSLLITRCVVGIEMSVCHVQE